MGPEARAPGRRSMVGVGLLVVAVWGCLWLAPDSDAATKPRLRITAKPAVVETGARVVVSGRVVGQLPNPAKSLRVRVQRRVGTRWRPGTSGRLARKARFGVRWRAPSSAGRLRLRLRLTRGKRVIATSRAWRLTVRRRTAPAPATGLGTSPLSAPPATLVIDASVVVDAPDAGASGVLILAGGVAVKAGDVLAAGIGPQTPYGFLFKATAVRVEAGRTVVDVVPATLLEAIPEGGLHTTFRSSRAGRRRSARTHFRQKATCAAGGQVTVEGSADLGNPQWSVDADWGVFTPKSVKATASVGASAHASASATGTASCTVGPIKLLETKFAPISAAVGPIPVIIVPELEIELDGLGQVDADVATSVDASITATAGANYENGRLSPIATVDRTFDYQPPNPHASAQLKATLSSELEAKFYNVTGPTVGLNAGLEMNADSAADPWWTLDAPISVTAGLDIDVLDIEVGPLTVYEQRFRLAEAPRRTPTADLELNVNASSTASVPASYSGGWRCSAASWSGTGSLRVRSKQPIAMERAFDGAWLLVPRDGGSEEGDIDLTSGSLAGAGDRACTPDGGEGFNRHYTLSTPPGLDLNTESLLILHFARGLRAQPAPDPIQDSGTLVGRAVREDDGGRRRDRRLSRRKLPDPAAQGSVGRRRDRNRDAWA